MDSCFSRQELKDIVANFSTSALSAKPDNIIDFAIDYFTELKAQKSCRTVDEEVIDGMPDDETRLCALEAEAAEERRTRWTRVGRRKSVCAENYDPGEDNISDIECYPKTPEQRQKILSYLQNIFLFRCQEDNQKNMIVDALKLRSVEANEVIIKQGEEGDFFYLVEDGEFEAIIEDSEGNSKKVSHYDNKGFFGELALMYNEPRAATVRAITGGHLWALSGRSFRRLILRSAYEKRQRYETLLQKVDQLKPLNAYERNIVCDALQPRIFGPGEEIIREGDVADGMYFVEEGEISISVEIENEAVEVCKLGPGGYFGELALVTNQPRAATVTSISLSKLAFLDVEAFERLLGPCMNLMKNHIKKYEAHEKRTSTL